MLPEVANGEPEVAMRIPRPKHCSRQESERFHSDAYLQAANKNKRRTTPNSVTRNGVENGATRNGENGQSNGAKSVNKHEAANGIKLHEMYTNRAFQD